MSRSPILQAMVSASDDLNEANDCTVMALTASTGLDYKTVHAALARAGRKSRRGCQFTAAGPKAAKSLGFELQRLSPADYSAKTMRTVESDRKLRTGSYICLVRGHVAALVDGQVIDWTEGRLHRIKLIWLVVATAAKPLAAIVAPAHQWRAVPNQLALI